MDDSIFTLIGNDGTREALTSEIPGQISKHLDHAYYALEIRQVEELIWLEFNDEPIDLDWKSTLLVPIIWKEDYTASLVASINGKEFEYKFCFNEKKIINKKIQVAYSDFRNRLTSCLTEKKSVEEVVNMVNSGSLPLLRMLNPETEIKDDSLIKHIDEKLQFAFNVCNRPRIHLKNEVELLDVERVKRINEQSLQHLASHSEHWKARTLSGIIPSRMNAEVFEDDYDIYENIFFRMAIEKISEFIYAEKREVERALRQNENLIDWDIYANQFSDYTRMKLIGQIKPDFDVDTVELRKMEYGDIFDKLRSIENRILGIQWSRNYQKISKTKVLSRPIMLTNILNMDKNYHEIYRLWNQLESSGASGATIGAEGDISSKTHESYFDFISIVIVHALSQLNYNIEDTSNIQYIDDKGINMDIDMSNDHFYVKVITSVDPTKHQLVEIIFTEKLNLKLDLPEGVDCSHIKDIDTSSFNINQKDNSMTFNRKPTDSERKELGSIYKKLMSITKGKEHQKYQKVDRVWRKFLSNHLDVVSDPRCYKIVVSPLIISFGEDEVDFKKETERIFNTNYTADSVYFVAPYELHEKNEYSEELIDRSLSFGELPSLNNKRYSRGLLPISQIEVNSVTRIMKIFEMTAARLAIEWGLDKNSCPICGYQQISHIDENTSKCLNIECGAIWGLTHCTGMCGEFYPWIRPDVKIESESCRDLSYLQLKTRKESWFGTKLITDFEMDMSDKYITFIPRCPHCG